MMRAAHQRVLLSCGCAGKRLMKSKIDRGSNSDMTASIYRQQFKFLSLVVIMVIEWISLDNICDVGIAFLL